jgi:hypothetical protein
MDFMQMLAAALRGITPKAPETAAKDVLGGSGAASRVNPQTREQYLQYVEQEIGEGRQPQRYDQWVGRAQPMTSQVN